MGKPRPGNFHPSREITWSKSQQVLMVLGRKIHPFRWRAPPVLCSRPWGPPPPSPTQPLVFRFPCWDLGFHSRDSINGLCDLLITLAQKTLRSVWLSHYDQDLETEGSIEIDGELQDPYGIPRKTIQSIWASKMSLKGGKPCGGSP